MDCISVTLRLDNNLASLKASKFETLPTHQIIGVNTRTTSAAKKKYKTEEKKLAEKYKIKVPMTWTTAWMEKVGAGGLLKY